MNNIFNINLLFNDLCWHILLLLLFNCIITYWFIARTLLQRFTIDQQWHRTAGRCHTFHTKRRSNASKFSIRSLWRTTLRYHNSLCIVVLQAGQARIRVVNIWTRAIAVVRTAQVINTIRVWSVNRLNFAKLSIWLQR